MGHEDLLDAVRSRTSRGRPCAKDLGALLADGRLGDELLETLEVYLSRGQNSREAARRLHLAPRTVAYRLERIEALLGQPLESAASLRLGAASLALRATQQAEKR